MMEKMKSEVGSEVGARQMRVNLRDQRTDGRGQREEVSKVWKEEKWKDGIMEG
jgi:hypothetical protein